MGKAGATFRRADRRVHSYTVHRSRYDLRLAVC